MQFLKENVMPNLPQSIVTALITSAIVGMMAWMSETFQREVSESQVRDLVEGYVTRLLEDWKVHLEGRLDVEEVEELINDLPPGPFIGQDESGNLMLYADPDHKIPMLPTQGNEHGVPY